MRKSFTDKFNVFSWNILAQRYGLKYLNREAFEDDSVYCKFKMLSPDERNKHINDPDFIASSCRIRYLNIINLLPKGHIIFLQEVDTLFLAMLSNSKHPTLTLIDYLPYDENEDEKLQVGLAILIHKDETSNQLKFNVEHYDRAQLLTISCVRGQHKFVNLHFRGFDRSNPNVNIINQNYDILKEILAKDPDVIVGDFNMDFEFDAESNKYLEIRNAISDHGLIRSANATSYQMKFRSSPFYPLIDYIYYKKNFTEESLISCPDTSYSCAKFSDHVYIFTRIIFRR